MADAARLPRFFVPPEADGAHAAFRKGDGVALLPTEAHHAAHVLRLRVGDAVELFDGCGVSAVARIARLGRSAVVATIERVGAPRGRPRPHIHLAFAVPKGRRLTWLLEKVTELGVASLTPVRFERSVAGAGGQSTQARQRWLGHCIAAAKQARLDWLPALEPARTLEAFLTSPRRGVYGDLSDAAQPVADAIGARAHGAAIDMLVGPEGGLTRRERHALDAAGLTPVRLGRTALRVETAAVALVAAAVAVLGR